MSVILPKLSEFYEEIKEHMRDWHLHSLENPEAHRSIDKKTVGNDNAGGVGNIL